MLTCLIVGEGTLPVQCAKALLERDIDVRGVSARDEHLKKWAADQKIPQFGSLKELEAFARAEPFDYLFSIVNYRIVPTSLLALPKALAINYHDSLLPRYAGVRATTWALINGESTHGITWHIMEAGIDTGDILKQPEFPIDCGDTVYKLNLKCYYTAIAAFTELVGELKTGTETRVKQDLSQRTYFAIRKRPANDSLLSFRWPAQRILSFCRGLNFEATPNVIGRPKMIIGGRLLMAPSIELAGIHSTATPGTVTGIHGESVQIATSTDDVIVTSVHTLQGRALSMSELGQYGLAVGVMLEEASLSEVTQPEQL
jgi:methionyl-tRNA formyltransferase